MVKFFRIVYVRIRDGEDGWPSEVETIRDWTWCQSPFVRWTVVGPSKVRPKLIKQASLIVLDWLSSDAPTAKAAYTRIRKASPQAKILVIKSGDEPWRDARVPHKGSADGKHVDGHTYGVHSKELHWETIEKTFKRVEKSLRVALPPATVRLDLDSKDIALSELRKWVGDSRLQLIIQKFFPEAKKSQVCSVGGGWSGARLCRLFIDGGSQLYFLKFSKDEKQYESDFANHIKAKKWLRRAAVDLKTVPAQGKSFRDQQQAFPLRKPFLLPLCFLSASTHKRPRETLHALYRTQSQDFLEKAFKHMLGILAPKRRRKKKPPHCAPWENIESEPFFLSEEMVRNALATMDDLKLYGPALCQNNKDKWDGLCQRIAALFGGKLPGWLSNPAPVVLGHTHGDPNPRNCLVHPKTTSDMQWIDCGDYKFDGRLVSDLAIVERDVKLVLLATEGKPNSFFDLDVTQTPDWCQAERDSIDKGMAYEPEHAPGSSADSSPVHRAYRLIGMVRQKARKLDPDGRHYLAALLFWTLDALKYRAVRPTKKLLALYSASEILSKFKS